MLNNDIVKYLKDRSSDNVEIEIQDEQLNYIGKLSLIKKADLDNDFLVESLTNWRSKYMRFFLTQFNANPDRTRSWLRNTVIPSGDRLLFLIFDENERLIGNSGVANIANQKCELDNLIRGEKGGHPKLIYFAELALLRWLFSKYAMVFVNLHVFSNNTPTIKLHTSVGFIEVCRKMLFKFIRDNKETYYSFENKDNTGEIAHFEYIEMGIDADSFNSMHNVS